MANCEGSGFDVGVSRTVFVYVRQRRRNAPVSPFAFLGRPSFGNRHFVKHLVNHRPVPRPVNHCDISTEKAVSLFFAFCFCLLVFNRRLAPPKILNLSSACERESLANSNGPKRQLEFDFRFFFLVIVSFIIQTNYAILEKFTTFFTFKSFKPFLVAKLTKTFQTHLTGENINYVAMGFRSCITSGFDPYIRPKLVSLYLFFP